jgi:hypothetical protein
MAKYNRQIVYCKDCIHRPTKEEVDEPRDILHFPDNTCPFQCEDNWYSKYPPDYFFCGYGKDKNSTKEDESLRITLDNIVKDLGTVETEILTLKDLSVTTNNIEENK